MDATTATEPLGSSNPSGNGHAKRNVGRIEEIQGVVIEAVFPDKLPEINHAITIVRSAAPLLDGESVASWVVLGGIGSQFS